MNITDDLIENWNAGWLRDPRLERSTEDGFALTETVTDFWAQEFGCSFDAQFSPEDKFILAVGAIGWARARVNGGDVTTDRLWPAQVDYRVRVPIREFDVTSQIRVGKNHIRITVGTGRAYPECEQPEPSISATLFRVTGGERTPVAQTSGDWSVYDSTVRRSGIYYGEDVDRRVAGDAPADVKPEVVSVSSQLLSKDDTVPIIASEVLFPCEYWQVADNTYVFDFGRNISGVAHLKLRDVQEGSEIVVRYAELTDAKGNLNTGPNRRARAMNKYIAAGLPVEEYEPYFTYHGFRYVEVSGLPHHPLNESVTAVFLHSKVVPKGSISLLHSGLTQLHTNILTGQLSNLVGIPTDCPQRDERQGWMGDAHLSAEEAILNFDMHSFYRDFLKNVADSQRKDGALPDVVPAYWQLYPTDPAWGTAFIQIAWLLYWYYGDVDTLRLYYSKFKHYRSYLERHAVEGIIQDLGKYGDWCPPGSIVPKRTPLEFTSSWYYWLDTSLIARVAQVLGYTEESEQYQHEADTIAEAINKRFLGDSGYVGHRHSPIDWSVDQTMHALALAGDIAPKQLHDKIVATLLSGLRNDTDHHADTGIVGTRYLLDVLTAAGAHIDAEKVATTTSYPGWLYMISEGASSLWERWEKLESGGMNSQNHIMLGSVDAWLYKQVAGIQCLEAGWSRIAFTPHPGTEISHAGARVETDEGDIAVSWDLRADDLFVRCTVPAGKAAVLIPPPGFNGTINLNDKVVKAETVLDPSDIKRESGFLIALDSGNGIRIPSGYSTVKISR